MAARRTQVSGSGARGRGWANARGTANVLPSAGILAIYSSYMSSFWNYTACADFPNVVAQRHIWGAGAHQGGYDPQNRTRPRFLYGAPPPPRTFRHPMPMFTRSEVIVLTNNTHTNKQTNRRRWKHPTLFATLRRWVIIVCLRPIQTTEHATDVQPLWHTHTCMVPSKQVDKV